MNLPKKKPTLIESNVAPLRQDMNRFDKVKITLLNETEQTALIDLALELLVSRHQPGETLDSPDNTRKFIRLLLSEVKNEIFGTIFLDNKHRVICHENIFFGTVDSASVFPRVVVQRAMEHNAVAVIFYHNHPSGNPEPSQSDQAITKRLKDSLALIDVRVLDHIVVGSESDISFAERGLL